jgi:predicted lysophospholipase L1 biosynthesis ABC-type transport system permease subunit
VIGLAVAVAASPLTPVGLARQAEIFPGFSVDVPVLAACLGAIALGNTMTVFVRRRRRDLAILKTLGFSRRQNAATVAWQATSFMLAALALGLPLGVAAGRWAWYLAAAQLESAAPPVIPVLAIALIVQAALLAGNALAALPARAAVRTGPGVVLRQE